jgi:hypothetical protein
MHSNNSTNGVEYLNARFEYSYDTFNEKDKFIKQGFTYSDVMNSRHSRFHIISLVLWILSLISLQFLLMQIFIQVRPFINTNRIETITFTFLIFAALACSWFIKTYMLESVFIRRSLMLFSFINILLLTYIIIADSYYILYMLYPVVALFFGIMFFSSKSLLDDFYLHSGEGKNLLSSNSKDLLFSIFSVSGFLVIVNTFVVMPNLQSAARWNVGLVFFGLLIIAIFVLSFFVADSPLTLYKNFMKEDVIRKLTDRIRDAPLKDDEWESVLSDIKSQYYQKEHRKYGELFNSSYLRSAIYYYILIFCCAFVFTNMIVSTPTTVFEFAKVSLQPDVPTGFMAHVSVFLFIGIFGYLIGMGMCKWDIIRKKWLVVISFSLILAFGVLMGLFWLEFSIIFAGFTLLLAYSLWYLLEHFSLDIFPRNIHAKIQSTFLVVFFTSAAISSIFIEGFNGLHMTDSNFTMAGFAIVGIVFTCLLKKVD